MTDLLVSGQFDAHVRRLRLEHQRRHAALLAALDSALPAGLVHVQPVTGGLYLWCRALNDIDTEALAEEARQAGVTIVPGSAFYPDDGGRREFRLCFTTAPFTAIKEGVRRLGRVMVDLAEA